MLGDSVTTPVVSGGGQGYPPIVAQQLDATWKGCAGGTLAQLDLPRCGPFEPELEDSTLTLLLEQWDPEVVSLLYGLNDAALGVAEADFVASAEAVADRILADGAREVIFLGHHDAADGSVVVPYYPWLLGLCAARAPEIRCGADLSLQIGPLHFSAGDILHPNEAGHEIIAEAVLEAVPEPTPWKASALALGVLALLRTSASQCWRSRPSALFMRRRSASEKGTEIES